jgi:hypothetical protein
LLKSVCLDAYTLCGCGGSIETVKAPIADRHRCGICEKHLKSALGCNEIAVIEGLCTTTVIKLSAANIFDVAAMVSAALIGARIAITNVCFAVPGSYSNGRRDSSRTSKDNSMRCVYCAPGWTSTSVEIPRESSHFYTPTV